MAMSWRRNRGLLGAWVVLVACLWQVVPAAGAEFADSSLAAAVSEAAGKPVENLTEADLAGMTQLVARERGIVDLAGMEQLASLQILDLADNEIEDLSPLSGLTQLQMLDLEHNRIRDLSPLAALPRLQSLILNHNEIEDVSPLVGLPVLASAELLGNPLSQPSLTVHVPALEAAAVEVVYDAPADGGDGELAALEWEYLGPRRAESSSVSVSTVAMAPSAPEVMYAGTSDGVWRSTNGGVDWAPTRLMARMRGVYVDAGDPGTVYASSASEGYSQADNMKSTDGGDTWQRLSVQGSLLAADPVREGRLYAVLALYDSDTGEGQCDYTVSDDGGLTWREIGSLDERSYGNFVHVHPANPSMVYVGVMSTLGRGGFVSRDGGTTWTQLQLGRPLSAMAGDPEAPEGMFGVDRDGVWYSEDGGATWALRASLPVVGLLGLVVHPLNRDWLWTWRFGNVWESRDGGYHWRRAGTGENMVQLVPHLGDADGAFCVAGRTLRVTRDGGQQWERVELAVHGLSLSSLAVDEVGHLHSAGWYGFGVSNVSVWLTSEDGGQNWVEVELTGQEVSGWFKMLRHDPGDPGIVVAHDPTVGFVRSEDRGATWSVLSLSAEPTLSTGVDPDLVIAAGEQEGRWYAVDPADVTLYRSDDGGRTWAAVREDVCTVAVSPGDGEEVFTGSWEEGSVWRSRDGGRTWTNLGTVAEGARVARLGIHPLALARLYAVTSGGVYVSEDEGETWGEPLLEFELTRTSGVKMRFGPQDAEVVYVTTGGQLWESRDSGQSWESLLEAVGSPTWINDLAVDPQDPEWLYVATPRGAYRWHSAGKVTAVGEERDAVPVSFALQANYPNPFNGETVIGYTVPAAGRVELTVYNVLGQRVASLVREEQAPGPHEVVWDGRDASGRELATGMYLCRLRSGGQVAVRRMLLLR